MSSTFGVIVCFLAKAKSWRVRLVDRSAALYISCRLSIIGFGEIHLLMTDVVMPGMSGRDLTDTLLRVYPEMKYLYMSGYTADVIAHHGVLDEGVPFIHKPFSKQDLAARVRDVLDESEGNTRE